MKRRALLALLPLPWLGKLLPERGVVNMLDQDGAMRRACQAIWDLPPGPSHIDVLVSERMVLTMEEIALYGHPALVEPWEDV